MAGDDETRKNLGRKLLKKKRDTSQPPLELPERFKDGDDAQEDVTAPKGKNAQYMNQSVFSMIAAAGSKVDFNARFDDDSSDSELEGDTALPISGERSSPTFEPWSPPDSNERQHRKKLPEHKLLKSLPKLNLRTIKEKNYMSQSTRLPSTAAWTSQRKGATPRDAPLMSQLIEAQAQLDPSSLSAELQAAAHYEDDYEEHPDKEHSALSKRLKEIFELESPERVISEYPCWLLKSVLLQGYMYITSRHVCFYAYLPKKTHVNSKSGYLSKRGKQNPKFNRYWFTLKGDVLSYYLDPSDLYFPSGNIDLRYSIQASLVGSKEKGKDSKDFTVTTHQRTYHFKADSSSSAKEWVRTLQKVIFRSHNEGDSVKISIPMANIIDIEDSPVLGFADTFKIRAVDNDDTYAVDEYFFSFFSFGKDALNILKIMTENSPAQHLNKDLLHLDSGNESVSSSAQNSRRVSRDLSPRDVPGPVFKESVKATLSPTPHSPLSSGRNSPRPSSDFGRSSLDVPRLSGDRDRDRSRSSIDRGRPSGSKAKPRHHSERKTSKSPVVLLRDSTDSYVHSLDRTTDSYSMPHSGTDVPDSPSQILDRSDVFQTPTIKRLQQTSQEHQNAQASRRHSEDNRFVPSSTTEIKVQPPTRSQTQTSIPKTKTAGDQKGGDSDSDSNKGKIQASNSSPSLQDLVKAGSYPLQRAAGFAGYLKKNSKRMSNLLASESMGYIEKVSGMWQGGRKHYDSGPDPSREPWDDPEDEEETIEHNDRFRAHFALPESERLEASFFGYLHRVLPLYGKVYVSNRSFCFRSLLPGTRTKMILPLKDVENVYKEKGFRFGYSGLVLVIRAYEELFFEFSASDIRDDCAITLLQSLETKKFLRESGHLTLEEKKNVEVAKAEHQMLQEARKLSHAGQDKTLCKDQEQTKSPSESVPVLFDDPRASIINFKPTESLRITCLTIGSRGDVQPYIALCKGFLKEGHKPKIATHAEFEPWIRKHGIDFAPVDGDPAELMRICVENGMFTYSFLKEASQKFRGWIDELLSSAWKSCQDSDILIESPSAMAGIHIAEALEIPYFRAFTMPWTRTRAYPHAFAVPDHKMGGAYNYFTYIMFDNVFWKAISGQVNRWRRKELGIRDTSLDKMQPNKVPFLYNFSPSVVVPPLDYSDWIKVTGYWFLDEAQGWKPPKDLTDFISLARRDKKKIVYVGFGSIVVSDPAALTRTIVDSVEKADVRCILSKGWSDRLGNKEPTEPEVPLPKSILQIKSAPHDWLFGQIDAAAHHGGAGTTGASLRAGIPTIIKPFFGDQFFFGSRIEDLGVGIYVKKLNVSLFSKALWEACNGQRIIVKAKRLGEQIRSENGVETAIQAIYRDLEYAKTLVKKKGAPNEGLEESEESWTFIGDDADPELTRRIAEWEPAARVPTESRAVLETAAKGKAPSGPGPA